MFNKEIRIKKKEAVRYGLTEKEPEETLSDIMKLLRGHGCEKVGTMYVGDDIRIGFELDGLPFLTDIPRVYVNNKYHPKIGIRIVFRYLETVMELTKKCQAVPIHNFLLPMAQVIDPEDGIRKPFGDVWIKNIAEGKYKPEKLLLGE